MLGLQVEVVVEHISRLAMVDLLCRRQAVQQFAAEYRPWWAAMSEFTGGRLIVLYPNIQPARQQVLRLFSEAQQAATLEESHLFCMPEAAGICPDLSDQHCRAGDPRAPRICQTSIDF